MQDYFTVSLANRQYNWRCDLNKPDAARSWEWSSENNMVIDPPNPLIGELNEAFGVQCVSALLRSTEQHESQRCMAVLASMGLIGVAIAVDDEALSHNLILKVLLTQNRLSSEIALLRKEQLNSMVQGTNPFDDSLLRDWLTSGDVALPEWLTSGPIMVTGCNPFRSLDFATFLERHELTPCENASEDVGVIIIGREDWSRVLVDEQIELRTGDNLRVLSQELLIAMIANGQDPFDGDDHRDVLNRFRTGHPGLEFVSEGWPGWVKIWVQPRSGKSGKRTFTEWAHNESLLKACGYEVGKTSSLTREQRRTILGFAFQQASIPPHCADWGPAGSGARLKAMAYHIKWLVESNAAETRKDMSVAVREWREDLDWLKERFYRGHMRFRWPDTEVG